MIYARTAALAALLAAFAWGAYADYHAGVKAGQDAIQAAWDKDRASIQAVAAAAIATATKAKEDALANNEAIANDYQKQLDASRANSTELAKRLLKYASAAPAGGGSLPKAGDRQGTSGAGTQAGDASLTNALGAALAECSANTSQLDALIVELKPQLR